jgi:hypothetical protein
MKFLIENRAIKNEHVIQLIDNAGQTFYIAYIDSETDGIYNTKSGEQFALTKNLENALQFDFNDYVLKYILSDFEDGEYCQFVTCNIVPFYIIPKLGNPTLYSNPVLQINKTYSEGLSFEIDPKDLKRKFVILINNSLNPNCYIEELDIIFGLLETTKDLQKAQLFEFGDERFSDPNFDKFMKDKCYNEYSLFFADQRVSLGEEVKSYSRKK